MQAYGKKKGHTHVAGHQQCGVCHSVQKNKTTRGRAENRKVIAQDIPMAQYSINVVVVRTYVIDVEADSPQAAVAQLEDEGMVYVENHADLLHSNMAIGKPELDD